MKSSPKHHPLSKPKLSLAHTLSILRKHLADDFTDHKRDGMKKPHLFSTPNHPPSTEAHTAQLTGGQTASYSLL